MMLISFLSGMGTVLGIALIFGAGYFVSKRNTPKSLSRPPTIEEDELERQREKHRAIQEDFTKLWQYDMETAYARKEVE